MVELLFNKNASTRSWSNAEFWSFHVGISEVPSNPQLTLVENCTSPFRGQLLHRNLFLLRIISDQMIWIGNLQALLNVFFHYFLIDSRKPHQFKRKGRRFKRRTLFVFCTTNSWLDQICQNCLPWPGYRSKSRRCFRTFTWKK